jgi:hypothetical protein
LQEKLAWQEDDQSDSGQEAEIGKENPNRPEQQAADRVERLGGEVDGEISAAKVRRMRVPLGAFAPSRSRLG